MKWVHKQLYIGARKAGKSRRPNVWNAFLKQRLQGANKGLHFALMTRSTQSNFGGVTDRGHGDRYKLPAFVQEHRKDLLQEYSELTEPERQELLAGIVAHRASCKKIVRTNIKAIQQDVNSTFKAMDTEVSLLTLLRNPVLSNDVGKSGPPSSSGPAQKGFILWFVEMFANITHRRSLHRTKLFNSSRQC